VHRNSTSGLALIGQCCEAAQVDRVIDPWLPVSQGIGYSPIAGYLGNEGWNVGLELRTGKWHGARQTEYSRTRASGRPGLVLEQENDVMPSRQGRLSWAEEGQLPLERALADQSPASPD
jgi:hypothetical protein